MEALLSYQQALDSGMPIGPTEMNGNYLIRSGEVAGAKRFDYAKVVNRKIQALVMFAEKEPPIKASLASAGATRSAGTIEAVG